MTLKIITKDALNFANRTQVYDEATIQTVSSILKDIRENGTKAIGEHAIRLGDIQTMNDIFVSQEQLEQAFNTLPDTEQALLKRTAQRIRTFAQAQRDSIKNLNHPIDGGEAGHTIIPMKTAGCYAPGGRFPLPSSVLMTVIPAKVAGVEKTILCSPKPSVHTLAAAFIAGADYVMAIGGAQAIGALAYGTDLTPACEIIVGPGNRWVTAAKQLVSGQIAIDMLAGPSELAVLADETANAEIIAADLLGQAEHDTDAWPVLISTSLDLINEVNVELKKQLKDLPTFETASVAISKGVAVHVPSMDDAINITNDLAAEHLEIMCQNPQAVAQKIHNAGGIFIGKNSAEVIGDYGAGPNHTLPTGGTARFKAGLSVFNFIKMTTWIDIVDPKSAQQLYQDSVDLARIEGLEAHARSAALRLRRG